MTDIVPVPNWGGVRQLETNEYATGGLNGNMNEQAKSLAGQNMYSRLYAGLPFDPVFTSQVGGFPIGGRAALENGDIVRSTVANNTVNPNTDMTGWVLSYNEKLRIFNVLDYGADPTGVLNSNDAFRKCSAALVANNGGVYVVPNGSYIIGGQDLVNTDQWRYSPLPPIDIFGVTGDIVIDFQGCNLKNFNGFYYGTFETNMTPSTPQQGRFSRTKRCTTGSSVLVSSCANVSLVGSATFDGNIQNATIGGVYGDFGIQIEHISISAKGNKNFVSSATVSSKNYAQDGVYVGDPTGSDSTAQAYTVIKNLRLTNNARQGISFCGGNGVIEDCYIEGIGDSVLTNTKPQAGIDVEQESGVIRSLQVNRTTVFNCVGVGMVSTTGDSTGLSYNKSAFVGVRDYSIYVFSGNFTDCKIVGNAGISGTQATLKTRGEYPTFHECIFSGLERDARGLIPFGNFLIEPSSNIVDSKAYFYDCDFYPRRQILFLDNTNTTYYFKGCTFYITEDVSTSLGQFQMCELVDCTFEDIRENPTVSMTVSRHVRAKWKNVKINSPSGLLRLSQAVTGTVGQVTDSLINPVNYLQLSLNGDTRALSSTENSTRVYSRTTLPTSPTANGNPFNRGDMLIAASATQTSWLYASCITAGYSCNSSWVASTAYTLSSYVYVSNRVYKCSVAGTSGSTEPTHTSGSAVDGTVTWEYLGALAEFKTVGDVVRGSKTFDPPAISAGLSATTTVSATGAVVGDIFQAAFTQYNVDIDISAQVSAANTVTVKFRNNGVSSVDLSSGTLTVKKI